jgi:sensor histidine kinase YesM
MEPKTKFSHQSEVWVAELTLASVYRYIVLTAVFNMVIAGFLFTVEYFRGSFAVCFIMSQSIGFSICFLVVVSFWLLKPREPLFKWLLVVGTILAGTVIGLILGVHLAGIKTADKIYDLPSLVRIMSIGLIFGFIVFYFYLSRHQINYAGSKAREEHLKRITSEKETAETELRLLQAQIEPHFLFNTLSNVLSLLDTDVKKGQVMLLNLTQYLRLTLDKSRSEITTLDQELDTVRAYMNIHKVRMGDRLEFSIDMSDDLKKTPLPPMLIQPLVENAIKHGLEPKVSGGRINIFIGRENGMLRIVIADTGEGISENAGDGVGLSNIRQRLKSLYGEKANLILKQNDPCGVTAVLEVVDENL